MARNLLLSLGLHFSNEVHFVLHHEGEETNHYESDKDPLEALALVTPGQRGALRSREFVVLLLEESDPVPN